MILLCGKAARERLLYRLLAAALGCALLCGCKGDAKTPQEAADRFVQAVRDRNAKDLFAVLDLQTRWSLMSIRRAHREAYDIVLSNFPEGPARAQQLRRFENGALAQDEATLFVPFMTPARWEALAAALPASAGLTKPTLQDGGSSASFAVAGKAPLVFRRGEDGSWGYAGYAAELEAQTRKATNDLEVIRTSAADYERAATRSGRK